MKNKLAGSGKKLVDTFCVCYMDFMLNNDRMHHSAVLTSAGIVVIGGYKTRPPWKERSVEILRDISLNGRWEIGKIHA